jgi:hypothetical protein
MPAQTVFTAVTARSGGRFEVSPLATAFLEFLKKPITYMDLWGWLIGLAFYWGLHKVWHFLFM